jgi:hypothetical protein
MFVEIEISLSSSENVISLYENMSGVQILPSAGESNTWNCTITGRLGHFTFDLALVTRASDESRSSLSGADDETENQANANHLQYVYTPTFSTATSPIAHRLPAYLHEEICFDADQLQSFFWRALHFLMNTK